MADYVYTALDNDNEFRLLTIFGTCKPIGAKEEILRCTLTHYDLPSKHPVRYDAISWNWGKKERLEKIHIVGDNDQDQDRVLLVRDTLIQTLKGLRNRGGPSGTFWIDAVCINQKNTHERDLQVRNMFEIYSCAESVCIWLGDHENNSSMAFEFIEKRVCDLTAFEELTEGYQEEWKAFAALMNRPWFSRRWVVQELALARKATVHCGKQSIKWANFETAVALFEKDARKIASQFIGSSAHKNDADFFGDVANMRATRLVQAKNNLFRINERNQILEYRFDLSALVSNLCFFEAQDPRDLIYAILSLASDTHTRLRTAPVDRDAPATAADAGPTSSPEASTTTANPTRTSPVNVARVTTYESVGSKRKRRDESIILDGVHLDRGQRHNLHNTLDWMRRATTPRYSTRFPPVNYEQSFFDLCKQFLTFTIPKSDWPNIDIICRPWAPKPKGEAKLPSWIPSIDKAAFGVCPAPHAPGGTQMKRKNADPLVGQFTYGRPYYNACSSQKATDSMWRFGEEANDENPRSFFIKGFILDEIAEATESSPNSNIPIDWLRLGGWDPWPEDDDPLPGVSSTLPDALWRTLVADRGPEGGNTKVYYRQAFEHAVRHSTEGVGLELTDLKRQGHSVLVELLSRIEASICNRRLFKTLRDENLGLAPKDARSQDHICILKGCSVPVVLRQVKDTVHYTFIGECYLHTMMNGQAVDRQKETLERLRQERGESNEMTVQEKKMDDQWFELR